MDDFVSTPGTCSGSGPADNMVPGSPEAPQQMAPKKTPWRGSDRSHDIRANAEEDRHQQPHTRPPDSSP
ncbi:Hypothetical predicted protein [Pelobates cultripes]|uniref:Uncharacterized protein n=1 Tax=Pelobates cultripes TaxID=61616 RepID=A0AAD1T7P4_PELCU|nr:Hypothetical predicted protein [Pelobates cultripes]